MEPDSKAKTAFSSHKGLFQFKVLPMGCCNSAATFERLMELVLRGYQWIRCLCYLDDVIIFGPDFDSALENLRLVFERLRSANLKLKPSKCSFFQKEVSFLGHVVSEKGIGCDKSKIDSVQKWPIPRTMTEIRSFLGLAGYYRKFIPNFSEVASPLTRLTKKAVKFQWDTSCQNAFEKLKESLVSAPILAYPEGEGEFILDTDASGSGIGAVLSQIQNGEEKVISYASKTLNDAQRKYCTTRRELLAVVMFVKYFRHFLWGRHFKIRTDHASLVWLKNFKDPEGILARWLTVLDTYDFTLEHRKGSLHTNADSLSRKPHRQCQRLDCPDCTNNSVVKISKSVDSTYSPSKRILQSDQEKTQKLKQSEKCGKVLALQETNDGSNWIKNWSTEEMIKLQKEDVSIGKILELKTAFENKPPKIEVEGQAYGCRVLWSLWESLFVRENLLYQKVETEKKNEPQIVLSSPKEVRSEIFKELHCKRTAGHLGRDKTLQSVKRRFFWPGMSKDIASWCKECDQCARGKPGPGLGRAPLQQSAVGSPFDRIGVDIMGPCPVTKDGNEYIIVLSDYFTKWVEAFSVVNHTALTVADKLVTEVMCRFGVPTSIHSDQGREFESDLFKYVCQLLEIEKTRTAPYRPNSDGLVERMNRTLKQMLSIFVNENRNDWDDHLPFLLMAYRATIHDSTGYSPFFMMFGRDMMCPIDVVTGNSPDEINANCPVQYVEWLKCTLENTYSFATKYLSRAASRQKKNYDRGVKPRRLVEGDFVWRWYPPFANVKFGLGWTGPYKIEKKISEVSYRIRKNPKSKTLVVHIDHLKPGSEGIPPEAWQHELPIEIENDQLNVALDQTIESDAIENESVDEIPVDDMEFEIESREDEINAGYASDLMITPEVKRTRCGRAVKEPMKYSP
ncbi:Retrovirus-related Pol polyprotein from transposon 17.6 [Mytilus edulis]|uniref:Retrovirus-related Pol polyprotein from transposon 17.6 n=1 Tax=Mytilus edulis TaxID=6550 RepID=A0A8S3UZG3_MYTED|nr:Retrovirus-related Pol polyprotein from transposon 17.6 [Mytilus edulis]